MCRAPSFSSSRAADGARIHDDVAEEKLAAAHVELRELAARAGELEASVDRVLSQLLER